MNNKPKIHTFQEAIADSEQYSKRHLMLGNGFSIGCRANIFNYASLFGEADFSKIPEAKKVFEILGTQDFEVAIKALEGGAKIHPIYAPDDDKGIVEAMNAHAVALKDLLVTTIAKNHPPSPDTIKNEEFWACRKFLSPFLASDKGGKGGHVFTLNYDLLLYWTLMHEDKPFEDAIDLKKNDGFGNDEKNLNADYVVWQGETAAHSAHVHFIHGALHLFDSGPELQKYTWNRKGDPLVEQARAAIKDDKFPLFVAEGTSDQKKNKIRHNAYLYQCFKMLVSNLRTGTHCFFIFGHSLADSDDHILEHFGKGKFKKLYIGIYGDSNSRENQAVIARAKVIENRRDVEYPLEVEFFDSVTANVWGKDIK